MRVRGRAGYVGNAEALRDFGAPAPTQAQASLLENLCVVQQCSLAVPHLEKKEIAKREISVVSFYLSFPLSPTIHANKITNQNPCVKCFALMTKSSAIKKREKTPYSLVLYMLYIYIYIFMLMKHGPKVKI